MGSELERVGAATRDGTHPDALYAKQELAAEKLVATQKLSL